MNKQTNIDQIEDEILNSGVSDELSEAAALARRLAASLSAVAAFPEALGRPSLRQIPAMLNVIQWCKLVTALGQNDQFGLSASPRLP
jgi:hypothetical protein